MKNLKKFVAAAAFTVCLVSVSNAPAVAGIIGNDSRYTSQVASSQFDSSVWKVAYTVSPRLADLLLKLSLI